jgi:hypothetical protein
MLGRPREVQQVAFPMALGAVHVGWRSIYNVPTAMLRHLWMVECHRSGRQWTSRFADGLSPMVRHGRGECVHATICDVHVQTT